MYAATARQTVFPRPTTCLACQASGCLLGHGFYHRKAWDWNRAYTIPVKRWYCKRCRRTTSLLPSCLLTHRRYVLDVIQCFVIARHEEKRSWRQLERILTETGIALSSIKRWCRSFAEHADCWRMQVEQTLAQHDSASPLLDAVGQAVHPLDGSVGLLQASLHLLAWAKTRWAAVASCGLNVKFHP